MQRGIPGERVHRGGLSCNRDCKQACFAPALVLPVASFVEKQIEYFPSFGRAKQNEPVQKCEAHEVEVFEYPRFTVFKCAVLMGTFLYLQRLQEGPQR